MTEPARREVLAFLEAIKESPEDDDPRAAYAAYGEHETVESPL